MIKTFRLANFKSYKDATLELGPLTLLIGANASGKSNAIEALQILSWLARGRRLDDVFIAVSKAELLLRGGIESLLRKQGEPFKLACRMEGLEWDELEVGIHVGSDGMRIRSEKITGKGEMLPLYQVEHGAQGYSHDISVSYNNFSRGGQKPQITCTDQQAVFTQLITPARFAASHKRTQEMIPQTAKLYIEKLQSILFLDPAPRRMRDYSFIVDRALKGDGGNVASTLFNLCEKKGQKNRVLEFIRDLPEQDITDILFVETQRREVIFKLTESFGGAETPMDASLVSDGSLRVLAIAAALLSAPEDSVVVIEEIDNGIHPSRAKSLLAQIEAVAKRRSLTVLLTSHNPALLDALPADSIPNVVFCYRDPGKGDSRLVRLETLPNYPELVAQGPLGRLVTQGVLDRMVKSARTLEDKKKASLAYVDELESRIAGK